MTGWVVPAPLTVLSTTISVLNLIHSAPLAGAQAPRPLALEANRLLRLVTVALISKVDGSCMVGQDNLRVCFPVLQDNKCKTTRGAVKCEWCTHF